MSPLFSFLDWTGWWQWWLSNMLWFLLFCFEIWICDITRSTDPPQYCSCHHEWSVNFTRLVSWRWKSSRHAQVFQPCTPTAFWRHYHIILNLSIWQQRMNTFLHPRRPSKREGTRTGSSFLFLAETSRIFLIRMISQSWEDLLRRFLTLLLLLNLHPVPTNSVQLNFLPNFRSKMGATISTTQFFFYGRKHFTQ
jgi:hypothetical protein